MGKIEYLTTKLNGYLSFNDIFVLLATGDGSRGGYVSLTGSGYTDSKTAAVTGANNSKIVIGANFQSVDNISSVNYTVNHTTSALKFTGNGSVNFTAQTGSTTLGKNSALTDSKICLSAKNTLGGDVVASYYTGYDRSAYTIWATDILTVDSDLSAVLKATASTSVDKVYNDDNVTFKGNTKGHTANAAALKASTIQLEKNFTGNLTASASFVAKNSDIENVKATEISGNTAMASGFFADSMTVVGQFGKKNGSGRTGTISATLTATLDASNNADGSNGSLTNNTLGAYGLNITNDLNLTTIDAVISAGMNRVILKTAGTQDKTMVNASGNTVETIGIKAGNITAGTFDAQIRAESRNKTISYSGAPNTQWGTPKYRGYSLNTNLMAGLYATNISVTSGIMKGTIKVISVNDRITDRTFCSDIYGVYAGDKLSIANGRMDSNISISVSGGTGVYQVVGVKTKTFDVGVFNGTLTINNENGDVVEYNVGIWADSFASTSPINISGVIDFANSSYNVGIMSNSTLNLTISGKINAGFGEYAVFSGTRSMDSISRPGSNNNDNITIIRDARVVGDIYLTNGEDTVTIDNTASVNGEISSPFGTLNLELLLTEKVNSDFTLKNSNLIPGDNTIIQINLNRAVEGTYNLIEGIDFSSWTQTGTGITFRFAGGKQTISFDNAQTEKAFEIKTDAGTVKASVSIKNSNLVVEITEVTNNYAGNYDIDCQETIFDAASKTWSLSWNSKDESAWNPEAVYELEYRIKNEDGSYATNWIRQTLSKNTNSYLVKDGEKGQTVEWRIRVNDSNGAYYGAWATDSGSDAGSEQTRQPLGIKSTAFINQNGVSGGATSAVMCLQWTPEEATPFYGLKNYVVEYFSLESTENRLSQEELATNWDALTENATVYVRTTTDTELYVSGLVNTRNYYWRVKEVDDRGQESGWTIGASFGVETTDKEGPDFSNPGLTLNQKYVAGADGQVLRTITITWLNSAKDSSGVHFYTITCKENPLYSKTFYVDANNPQESFTYTFDVSEVGSDYNFTLSATDYVGNKSDDIVFFAKRDAVNPRVESSEGDYLYDVTYIPGNAKEGVPIHTIQISFTIKAFDDESGLNLGAFKLMYGTSSTSTEGYTTISGDSLQKIDNKDGTYTLVASVKNDRYFLGGVNWEAYYWVVSVVDNAGNSYTTDIAGARTDWNDPVFDESNIKRDVDYKTDADGKVYRILSFTWTPADDGDGSGVAYYIFTMKGIDYTGTSFDETIYIKADASDIYSYTFKKTNGEVYKLSASTSYSWSLAAVDRAGNETLLSLDLAEDVTPPEFPEAPLKTPEISYIPGSAEMNITIEWDAATDEDSGIAKYEVYYKLANGEWSSLPDATITITADNCNEPSYKCTFYGLSGWYNQSYEYKIVAYDKAGLYSSITGTFIGDTTAPIFTSTNSGVTAENFIDGNTENVKVSFKWSTAYDDTTVVSSGVEGYYIYYSTGTELTNAIKSTLFTGTSAELYKLADGIKDGVYNYWIAAVDYAGNETVIDGSSQFTVDTTAPTGSFGSLDSKLTIAWEIVDDPRGSNYVQVRQPLTIDLTLTINGEFTDPTGVYYEVSFYTSENCKEDSLIFVSPEFAASTTYSLTSSNNLIAYLAEYADALKRDDTRPRNSLPTIYWKVRAVDGQGHYGDYSQTTGSFQFFDEDLNRPTNDYYAPNAPKLKAVRALTEDDLSREEFSGLTDAQKAAYKQYMKDYPGSLYLIEWDPVYDAYGIKSYKIYTSNGKETTVYDTYKDGDMLTYISAGKVLAGLYGTAPSGKRTFWVSAVDGSGLESVISNKITYTYFNAKGDIDGNNISDILFQYIGGDNQLGFWMNGTSSWQGQGMAQPTDWEVKGAFDMNVDGKADVVLVGNVTVNGVKGAYIGYYDGGDTSKWVNIGYLTNTANINWNVKVANITGTRGTSSIIWHDQDHGVLGVWTDGTDNWTQIKGGFSGDWVLKGAGDFNGDGEAEILFDYQGTFYTTDINGNLTNLGTGFGSAQGWEFAAIGDFSCDGQDDMILFNNQNGLVVKLEDGLTKSWKKLGQLDAKDWSVVGAGDYNGDKKDDLLVRQKSTGMLGYYDGGDFSKWCEVGRGVDSNWTVIA